jgi:hypothetical protein
VTDPGPSEANIVEALQASGYLLEQEVATAFQDMGFEVRTSAAYEDRDSGRSVSREIDVLATKNWCDNEEGGLRVMVEVICECKSSSAPFVFLVRPVPEGSSLSLGYAPKEFLFPIQTFIVPTDHDDGTRYRTIHHAVHHLDLETHHHFTRQPYSAVHVCKVIRNKNTWTAETGDIYNGTFMPIVKAFLHRRTRHEGWIRGGHPKFVYVFFPIVVVNARMYAVDTLAETLQPTPIDHIHYRRELDAESTSGVFGVDFVTSSSLRSFVEESIQPFVDEICRLAQTAPEKFLQGEDAKLEDW